MNPGDEPQGGPESFAKAQMKLQPRKDRSERIDSELAKVIRYQMNKSRQKVAEPERRAC